MNVAPYIDHTILKAATVVDDINKLCAEALQYKFAAVCVPPPFVNTAKNILQGSNVHIATVIGFPFGYSATAAKLKEVEQAIEDGADELDVVINIPAVKSGLWNEVNAEMKQLIGTAHDNGKLVKVIIESGILTDQEIISCCRICSDNGADFVKTSTGYAETGATLAAVQLMRVNLPSHIRIKASGGIKTSDNAEALIRAGANRIGTSAGISIVTSTNVKD